MFKKREKKQKMVNLAADDLNDKSGVGDNDNLELIKKDNKKINKNGQDNKQQQEAIQQRTEDTFNNMHFKGTNDMHANEDNTATVSLDESLGKRAEMIAKIRDQAQKGNNPENLNEDGGDKYYKGEKNKRSFIKKSENDIRKAKYTGTMGPMMQASNVRMTCNFDYNPEICKDYKETGQCSFGDSCLYIHDRGDYKFGWEMEQEYEQKKKLRAKNGGMAVESSDDEDMQYAEQLEELRIPKECPICDNRFVEPVVTLCGHYFCENCALQHYQNSKVCAVCGAKTNGIFNDAIKELEKLKRDRKNLIKKRNEYRISVNKQPISAENTADEQEENDEDGDNSDQDSNQEDSDQENNNNQKKRKASEEQNEEYDQDAQDLSNVGKQLQRIKQGQSSFKQTQADWNYY